MITTTVRDIVATLCPGKEEDPRLEIFLELATAFVAESAFLTKYNYALALVVCHQFQLETQGGGSSTISGNGAVGGISSIKEGQLEKKFGGPSTNMSESKLYWGQTSHGMSYLALCNACIMGPMSGMI